MIWFLNRLSWHLALTQMYRCQVRMSAEDNAAGSILSAPILFAGKLSIRTTIRVLLTLWSMAKINIDYVYVLMLLLKCILSSNRFTHPGQLCSSFPLCGLPAASCLYRHPPCKFNHGCTNPNCLYAHSEDGRSPLPGEFKIISHLWWHAYAIKNWNKMKPD